AARALRSRSVSRHAPCGCGLASVEIHSSVYASERVFHKLDALRRSSPGRRARAAPNAPCESAPAPWDLRRVRVAPALGPVSITREREGGCQLLIRSEVPMTAHGTKLQS